MSKPTSGGSWGTSFPVVNKTSGGPLESMFSGGTRLATGTGSTRCPVGTLTAGDAFAALFSGKTRRATGTRSTWRAYLTKASCIHQSRLLYGSLYIKVTRVFYNYGCIFLNKILTEIECSQNQKYIYFHLSSALLSINCEYFNQKISLAIAIGSYLFKSIGGVV